MNFNDYQNCTGVTAIYDDKDKINYPMIGLCSEVGEVADKIKKNMRDGNTYSKEDIAKELGDCLWYIAALCRDLDINMEDVAEANLEKLRNRMKQNTISGSGDDR